MAKIFNALSTLVCFCVCFLFIGKVNSTIMETNQCIDFITNHCYAKTITGNFMSESGWMIKSNVASSSCYNEFCTDTDDWVSINNSDVYRNVLCEELIKREVKRRVPFVDALDLLVECKVEKVDFKKLEL